MPRGRARRLCVVEKLNLSEHTLDVNIRRCSYEKFRFSGFEEFMLGHLPLPDRLSGVVHLATGTGKSYAIFAVAYLSLVMELTKRVLVLGDEIHHVYPHLQFNANHQTLVMDQEVDAATKERIYTMKAEFTAIIEPAPEGGYWAVCPEVQGASGQGIKNIRKNQKTG